MAAVAAGEVSPEVFGNVYCIAIEGCQEIGAFDRVAEWTSALHRWCASQPGLVVFTGQCSVHRGQVMRQQGAWAGRWRSSPAPASATGSPTPSTPSARPRASAATCSGCGASTPRPRRRTSAPASTASTPSRGSRCSGWRAARATRRRPPYAGWWRRPATRPAGAACCPRPSTSCSPSTRSTRPARCRRSSTGRVGRRLGRAAGALGVRLGRGRARRRRRRRGPALPAQGAPALDARRVPLRGRPRPRSSPAAHSRPRRRGSAPPGARRPPATLRDLGAAPAGRGGRRASSNPPACPAASPPARSRCSGWSPPAAATPRSPPT